MYVPDLSTVYYCTFTRGVIYTTLRGQLRMRAPQDSLTLRRGREDPQGRDWRTRADVSRGERERIHAHGGVPGRVPWLPFSEEGLSCCKSPSFVRSRVVEEALVLNVRGELTVPRKE